MTYENNTEKKTPAFYIFMQDKNGNSEKVGAAFYHNTGNGMNILIGNRLYAAFPPKQKSE